MADKTGRLSRRGFLKGALGLASLWPLLPRMAAGSTLGVDTAAGLFEDGSPPLGEMPLEELSGEQLEFRVGFWIFSHAGSAELRFAPSLGRPGLYEALLVGQTSGLIGFFTRYRKDTYHSVMELEPTGRLRPIEFDEEVIIGHELRRRRKTLFDYGRRVMVRRRTDAQGKEVERYEVPMRPGIVYDDYLSGLYNVRLGAYGPMREGRTYRLHVPHKKESVVRIELAGPEENRRLLERAGHKSGRAYFSRVILNKDKLGSGTGRCQGWFSAQAVPLSGLVEDVVLLGDVEGILTSRSRAPKGV